MKSILFRTEARAHMKRSLKLFAFLLGGGALLVLAACTLPNQVSITDSSSSYSNLQLTNSGHLTVQNSANDIVFTASVTLTGGSITMSVIPPSGGTAFPSITIAVPPSSGTQYFNKTIAAPVATGVWTLQATTTGAKGNYTLTLSD